MSRRSFFCYWGSFVACLHDVDLSGGHRGADTRVVLEHLDERHVVRQHDVLDVGLFLEVLRYSAVGERQLRWVTGLSEVGRASQSPYVPQPITSRITAAITKKRQLGTYMFRTKTASTPATAPAPTTGTGTAIGATMAHLSIG